MKTKNPANLFLRQGVPEKIICFIKSHHGEINISKLSRKIDSAYISTRINIKLLEEMSVVEIVVINGRNKLITLTNKGKEIAKCLNEFYNF